MIKITKLLTRLMCFALLSAVAGGNAYAQGNSSDPCGGAVISSVFPASGPYNTVVEIEGSGFTVGTGTTSVQFNGINAAGFSVVADNLIKAVVPQDATTGALTITTNGCIVNVTTFTVLDSPCNTSNIVAQPFSQSVCEFEDATFTVTVDMPEGFNYQWRVLNNSGHWVNVTDGPNYTGATSTTLTIVDAPLDFVGNQYYCVATLPACTLVSNAVQLTVSPIPVVILNTTDATCLFPTGSVSITPSVGEGLTYSTDGTTYTSDTTITGLSAGPHSLFVKSSAGCVSVVPFTINSLIEIPDIATFTVIQPNCNNPKGSIEITGPLQLGLSYSIGGGVFQPGTLFNNLDPGTYQITVQTLLGCTSVTAEIAINPVPETPVAATVDITQPTCEVPTGTIEVTAPLGSQYTYSINGTDYQASTTFSGLGIDNYTVYVKDGGSCPSSTSTPVTINAVPNTPIAATATATQPTCTTQTGSVTVTAPVGAGYTYSIDNTTYQSSTAFNGLQAGDYIVYVRFEGSCPSQTATPVTINQLPAVPAVAAVSVTQPTCNANTGTIVVTSPVGNNYTYSIDDVTYQSATAFLSLAPGDYTVYVKFNGSCPSQTATPVTINPVPTVPAIATISVTQPNCSTSTGTIEVTAPLGSQYMYSLDNTNYQASQIFSNLTHGDYTVYVKEGSGCPSAAQPVTLNAVPATPVAATVSTVQPTCQNSTGTIEVNTPIGANYTYSIDGSSYQSSTTFTGLTEGSYMIYVKNGESCASTGTAATINALPNMPEAPVAVVTQPSCASGGIIEVTSPSGYAYSINGGAWQASMIFENLTPGDYVISAQNAQGCTSYSQTFTILENTAVTPVITSTQGCENNAFGKAYVITTEPSDNSFDADTATYVWKNEQGNVIGNNEAVFNVSDYLNGWAQNAQFPLQLQLTVTTPGGCTNTFSFVVEGSLCGIPKGISPNNDGLNDSFNLIGMNASKVSIFNRYGTQVYSKESYRNEWIGQGDNGGELPSGTYYYVIEAAGKSQSGWVYVNREEN